jgi:hypothetical protein
MKRKDSPILAWIASILFVLSLPILIISMIIDPSTVNFADDGSVMFFPAILSSVSAIGVLVHLVSEEYIDTTGYTIYKFELWDQDTGTYEPRFEYDYSYVSAKYILTFHYKNIIYPAIPPRGAYNGYTGYLSEKEVMEHILQLVKERISVRKENQNIRIKNFTAINEYTILQLEDMVMNSTKENN